jgi:hypothetical protein
VPTDLDDVKGRRYPDLVSGPSLFAHPFFYERLSLQPADQLKTFFHWHWHSLTTGI